MKGNSKEIEISKEGFINEILQQRDETTKSYVKLKKESDASNKLQILSKVMQRSDETTAFSNNLKTEINSGNNLKILSKVNQDERTRLPELREKSENRIINENSKSIRNSQTILCLKEDSKYITTSKEKERHDENKRLNESRVLSETIVDEKEKKTSFMNKNIIEHETSKEVFKMKLLQTSDETTAFSKKLKVESDSGNNLKILSKVIQDERTRLPKLRKIRDNDCK